MSEQRLIDANKIRYVEWLTARGNGNYEPTMVAYQDEIDCLPTIEKRKTGKWICSDDLYETAICPFCGWDTTEPYGHIRSWFRYCPRCGARLVQEGEDNGKAD